MNRREAIKRIAGAGVVGAIAPADLRGQTDDHPTNTVGNEKLARTETPPLIEPNWDIASTWWPELPKKWTAVGWKDHILRFNVLFDGSIINHIWWMPKTNRQMQGPCTLFSFLPAAEMNTVPVPQAGVDPHEQDGLTIQGWNSNDTPVLWTEWPWQGMLLRQEVFAHVPGGQDVVRGDEPLFAWIRMSVHYVCEAVPVPEEAGFGIQINANALRLYERIVWDRSASKYERELRADAETYDPSSGFAVLEPDNKVRLAVAPGQNCAASFKSGFPTEYDSVLHVQMESKRGAHVDLLIPAYPMDRKVFDSEVKLGYDLALAEAERYWARTPPTAARFGTTEVGVNESIRRHLQTAEVVADKDPKTGDYVALLSAFGYQYGQWTTPNCMTLTMLLDMMGYHLSVEKYLSIYKKSQGTVVPPGPSFKPHPGYLGGPDHFIVVHWIGDHGSILNVIGEHALMTGDQHFIDEYLPTIIKGCEWVQYARRIKGHGGVDGLIPPAGSSDDESRVQSIWNDGWSYKGLTTAVKLLKRINHPRAEEFALEARDYRETFQQAFRARCAAMPKWTDASGQKHILAPNAISAGLDWQLRHIFYLDTGPIHAVYSGLMDADDHLMKDALLWFREGPPTKLRRINSHYDNIAALYHEVSCWEPCYSWNVFHSWQLADRGHFLEGMYSLYAGGQSRMTYSVPESRAGISALTPCVPADYLARLAVVDDQIKEGELHLLRLMPLAWLRRDADSSFENMPTEFGPITLKARLSENSKELKVVFIPTFRLNPTKVLLHIPPVNGLRTITLNGKPVKWDRRHMAIPIPL